jgi:membrane protease YdiL (CAAX protease family)
VIPTPNPRRGAGAGAGKGAAVTAPVRRRVPRWGSVAQAGIEGAGLSTAPEPAGPEPAGPEPAVPGRRAAPARPAAPWTSGAVLVGGVAFLLGRLAVGGLPSAVPVLAVGYLAVTAGALAVEGDRAGRGAGSPLGRGVPLVVGLVGVAGAAAVAGPVADRRTGVVAAGLALLAAVAEEALFRRVLYDRLLRFGAVAAVTGSAVAFALVHLPAYGLAAMPVDLGAALLLGWQRYASGRWTVPAVTHAVANLLAVT